jgi:hypothetical protein
MSEFIIMEYILNENESVCCFYAVGHVPKDQFIKLLSGETGGDFTEDEISYGRMLNRKGLIYFGDYKIGCPVTYYKEAT